MLAEMTIEETVRYKRGFKSLTPMLACHLNVEQCKIMDNFIRQQNRRDWKYYNNTILNSVLVGKAVVSPPQWAIGRIWIELQSYMGTNRERLIIGAKLLGFKNIELAEELKVTPQAVSKIVSKIRRRIEHNLLSNI